MPGFGSVLTDWCQPAFAVCLNAKTRERGGHFQREGHGDPPVEAGIGPCHGETRHPKKDDGVFRSGFKVRNALVTEHRALFSVRAKCQCLRIRPSGFYAWLKTPLTKRAREDKRQAELLRTTWDDSGKVYGYRKLLDSLLDEGERVQFEACRPTGADSRNNGSDRLQTQSRQIWRQTVPGRRQRAEPAVRRGGTGSGLGDRYNLYPNAGWGRESGRCHRSQIPPVRRVVDAKPSDHGSRATSPAHGRLASEA